jgi:prefoldin subunit 5
MDTDEHEPGLLRRIEELAAQAGDDSPEAPVLAAALAGLREEIGSLRADLTSLRADLAAVRTSVDANIGRLAGDVSAGRAEAGGFADRNAHLGERVEELAAVLDGVAAALPVLRAELAQLPEGTAGLENSLRHLEETLLSRVDTAVGDLRRTVSTGLTQASAGGRAAEVAANDTRSVLEERLAAVEDTIDGLAENIEAVTRDSIGTATQHIRQVDASLGSIGESLTDAVVSGHGETREHVENLAMQLRDIVELAFAGLDSRLSRDRDTAAGGVATLSGFLEAFQSSTEVRLEELEGAIGSGLTEARDALLAELTATIEQLTQANGDTRRLVEDETGALRADLADALEEVRDRISTLMIDSSESITGALDEQRTTFADTARVLREDVLDRVEESRADVLSTLDELRAGVSSAARHGEETGGRLRELAEVIGSLYATIGELRIEWDARSEAAVASAREAAEAATAEFRGEVDGMMASARAAMDRQAAAIDDAGALLNGGVAKLVTAGDSLLGYLAHRDQLLEQERDRVLHDALDAFASGLSAKERRSTANRLADVIDRRRDTRDAERWRRSAEGAPAIDIPTPPEGLAALADPIRPRGVRGSGPRRAAAAEAEAERAAATPAPPPVRPAPARARAAKASTKTATAKTTSAKTTSAKTTAAKPAAAKTAAARSSTGKTTAASKGSAARSASAPTRSKSAAEPPPRPSPGSTAKAPAEGVARRRRASLREMPVVPSPDAAVDAAVGPAPAPTPTPKPTPAPAPDSAPPSAGAPDAAPDVPPVAQPGPAEEPPLSSTGDQASARDVASAPPAAAAVPPEAPADTDAPPSEENEPAPAKPWWNPTGGRSDEPDRGDEPPPGPAG